MVVSLGWSGRRWSSPENRREHRATKITTEITESTEKESKHSLCILSVSSVSSVVKSEPSIPSVSLWGGGIGLRALWGRSWSLVGDERWV